ncbi:MAG: RNA-binding protein [Deltaproteobacteria bacterium]|nr:MAG: RNA-binding protein [Deltaproteobacteria bacterium]
MASKAADLLGFIVRGLVHRQEAIEIEEILDDHGRVLKLRVDEADLGRVIGKEGRTAAAIRALLAVATAGDDKTAKLDIVE